MDKNKFIYFFVFIMGMFSYIGFAQEYTSFTRSSPSTGYNNFRYETRLRGDLVLIGNSILNRDSGTAGERPNDDYNNLLNDNSRWWSNDDSSGFFNYNDYKNMQYIDVDAPSEGTFNSSTASFSFADNSCNIIRYAGLYWSATYPSATANGSYSYDSGSGSLVYQSNTVPVGDGRQTDFNQVRFKVPGGSYVDITADEVLYDGFTSTDSSIRSNSPYACYADVTALITPLLNPEGDYTVANIRATTGGLTPGGGSTGGWALVIIYENPNLPGRYITTFDGFARVNDTNSIDIDYSGFTTIPSGPVYADLGAATLEGDFRIVGDGLAIQAEQNSIANGGTGFVTISDAANDANNFFNSNVSSRGAITTTRNPASFNTLGFDVDLLELANTPGNSIIPNNETEATFRFSTDGDQYYPFFNSFSVEIIEPNIVLEKRVNTPGGVDITGQGVNLGQILDYVLTFQNVGNDDGDNYTIRDVLPVNVSPPDGRTDFIASDFDLPPGVGLPTYDPATREVVFTIPNDLVVKNGPDYVIRFTVQVAENCFDFVDACSTTIENVAYSTYRGIDNPAVITDDPSVTDFDTCGYTVPGATNFLLDDLENCDFNRTAELCGNEAILQAGSGFDSYIWYRDENNDGLIDSGDTLLDDGDPDNDPSTFVVTTTGTYIVDKIIPAPCIGFQEVITVVPYGTGTIPNPIIEFFNDVNADADPFNDITGEIVQCSIDNDDLPKLFLCGIGDTKQLQVNIADAQTITWELMGSCSTPDTTGDDCANKDLTCSWTSVGTGNSYVVNNAGKYRLSVTYQNGCTSRFYFNVFQNTLDIQYNERDIFCTNPGNITITNLGTGYGYQLVNDDTDSIIIPFSANNGPSFDFNPGENGSYIVQVTQLDASGTPIPNACVFETPVIGILDRQPTYNVTPTNEGCTEQGAINIQVSNVRGDYNYELQRIVSGTPTLVDDAAGETSNNFTFSGLTAGEYIVSASTADGCSYSENVTISNENDLELTARVSQHITCKEGNILMESTGGTTPHNYAIWSYIDDSGTTITSYADPNDIPPSEFQQRNIFDILDPGEYTFVVFDRNNCYAFSNTVTIEFQPAATFNATAITDVNCFGDVSGAIQFDLVDDNGFQLTYYLFDAATFDENLYNVADAIATNGSGFFPNLGAGDYAIVINQRKGSSDCDYFEYYTISTPANALNATSTLIQDYTCTQEAIIEAQNITGGTAPYSYSIDGVNFVPDTTPNANRFENLTDGTYTITVRDANDCEFDIVPAIVIDPLNPPTDLTFTATAPNCPTQISDVTVTVTDGNAPFVFEIIAPSSISATSISGNSANFDGLAPDTYNFRTTDNKGCVYEETFTINPVTPIGAVGQLVSNVTCFNGNDGEARFTVSGFGTNFNYSVTGPSSFNGTNETSGTIDLTGLTAGTYEITVTDNITNCTDTASVIIQQPTAALALMVTETQPTCITDGSVNVSATGGWGGYSYALNNPDASLFGTNTSGNFSGLTQSGTYNGIVTDTNGCTEPFSFVLNAAVAPVLEIVPNDNCYTAVIGLTLTANVTSGGDGNFEYSLNGGPFDTTNTFSGLAPGTHTINVRDGNDCTSAETITINPELTVIASADPITVCGTDTDITITAAGGDGNYVYSVVPDGDPAGTFATTNPVSVSGIGVYDVYVRDNAGGTDYCEAVYEITIAQDAPIVITPTLTDNTCFGATEGEISLAVSGGEPPYRYSIDGGSNYQTTTDFFNLAAGTYNISILDANNCPQTATVTIDQPDMITADAAQTLAYTCNQLGEISVGVGALTATNGGSGDYQYSINGAPWTASTTGGTVFTGLSDGTYTIRVRDAAVVTCFITLPDVIIPPLPVAPTLSESVSYNCDGTGNITILPNDPSYTYSLDGGTTTQTINVFNNIAVGTYTVTVDYGSDCETDIAVTVEAGNQFEASVTAFENLDCNGDNSGTITIDANNYGVGGFEYSLDNFTTTPLPAETGLTGPTTINGLAAGNYTITVRDVDNPVVGCTVTLNQTVTEPTVLTVSNVLTQPTCISDGSVVITPSGGIGGYTYEIAQPNGAPNLGPQTSGTFSGLSEIGVYTITVTDANGCTATDTFTTIAASNPTASIDPTSDLCYSSSIPGAATVVVGAADGVAPYLYSINGGPTRTSNTFTDLIPGNYTFTVTDSNGCSDTTPLTIAPQLTANLVLTKDLDCSASPDAILTLTTSGGYGPFTYELSTDSGTNYSAYTGALPYVTAVAGTYRFRITDTEGCMAESNDIEVSAIVNPQATATLTNPTCNGDSNGIIEINIDPAFGTSPYEVSFEGSSFTAQRVYPGLAAGNYTYIVRDSKSCTFTETVMLTDPVLFDANVVPTDVSCGPMGDVPGSIAISITSGGTPGFTYTLYDNLNNVVASPTTNPIVTSATSVTFDNLDFGDYYVRIIDANGCEYYENPVRVFANPYLSVDAFTPAVSCITGATVDLLASGGSGTYDFSVFGSSPLITPTTEVAGPGADEESATFDGLTPGQTYIFEVIDTGVPNGCSSYIEVIVPPVSSIDVVADPTITDVTCFGDTDGSIAFQFEAYDASVTDINYEIRERLTNAPLGAAYSGTATGPNGPGPTVLETVSNIPPGDYVLYFIEATNPSCSNTYEFRILEPTQVVLTVVDQNNGNCNEDANVTVIASGGNGSYTYAFVEDGDTPVAGDYTNTSGYAELDASVNTDWDVYVLDGNGCAAATHLDISIADDPLPVISAVVANQCAMGAEEGDFIIEVTLDNAGIQPFNLSLNGGGFQTSTLTNAGDTYQFTGLSSGNYTIEVRDFNGCGNSVSVEIFPPTSISAEVTTQPTCLGSDGEALITAYGGSGNFRYELFLGAVSVTGSPQVSPTFTGLNPGIYTAFVYDQVLSGCDAQIDLTLEVPTAVVFTTASTDVSCFGATDGTITATLDPAMDNPVYTYQLFDSGGIAVNATPQTSNVFTGLAADTYNVRVFSGRGCLANRTETVGGPTDINTITLNQAEYLCPSGNNQNNASITITGAIGGSGTYVRYDFYDNNGTVGNLADDSLLQSGTNDTYIITGILGGDYRIDVFDDNGCSGSTHTSIAPFDELLSATIVVVEPISCIAPGNLGEDVRIDATSSITNSTANPGNYEFRQLPSGTFAASNTFADLAPGNYTFEVRNVATGCIIPIVHRVEEPNTFDIQIDVQSNVICFGSNTGEVAFSITDATYTGGFNYQVFTQVTNIAQTAVLNHANLGPTPVVNLGAGDYYVVITQDGFPECTNQENFSIAGPDMAITGDTEVTQITCTPLNDDGIIQVVDVEGGWGGYQYYVSTTAIPDEFDASNYVTNPRFDNLTAGTYEVWIIDSEGCPHQLTDVVLNNPTAITADLQINQENCINLEGEISVVNVLGGQGTNYTYQLYRNGTPFGASQGSTIFAASGEGTVFSGLGEGIYEVMISDQWSCVTASLIGPRELYEEMNLGVSVQKQLDCTATPEGAITVTVNGGSTNLEFSVFYPGNVSGIADQIRTDGMFTNLPDAGVYTFRVRDLDTTNPVCEKTITQSLDAPVNPTLLDATIVDVSCFGGSDGSILASLDPATDVNPIYQYELIGISAGAHSRPLQNSPLFDGLPAGDYQVRVVSGRGCEDTKNETIAEPTQLLIDASATAFACSADNTVNTATITVAILDGATTPGTLSGTSPYLYSIDNVNFQTANTFEIIDTGAVQNITVYVTDGNSCPQTDTVRIDPINTFTATVAQDVAISCANPEEVTITVIETGTPGDVYTFELLPVPNTDGTMTFSTNTSAEFDLTEVGTYTFRVTNQTTGCYVDTAPYTIAPYDLIEATAVATAPVTCLGDDNGELEIDVRGYSGNYSYQVFDSADNPIGSLVNTDTSVNPRPISGLPGGNYYVRIIETDVTSSRCFDDTNTVTIISPSIPLDATVSILSEPTCDNDRGEIQIIPEGGYPPYDIIMTNTTTGQPAYTATDVFSVSFEGLSAGNFDITVTDNIGCVRPYSEVLNPATPIIADATPLVTNLACYGDTGAVVTANITGGGSGNYEYILNTYDATGTTIVSATGQQSSPDFNDLGAGIYSVTVVDGWNCDVTTNTVEIIPAVEVEALLLRTDPLTCATGAEFELSATGGSGTYEYSTDNIIFLPMTSNPLGLPTTAVLLPAGTYQYYVRDAINGCEAVLSNAITEDPIMDLILEVDSSAAFINCTGESTASIYAEATGGLGNYRYELYSDYGGPLTDLDNLDPALLSVSDRMVGPIPMGEFRDLPAGTYYVNVFSGDCTASPVQVIIEEPIPLTYTEAVSNVSCQDLDNGSITVTLSGGAGGYQYAISPNLNQFDTINSFTDLAPGIYTVIAQDQNGCFEYLEYTITEPTAITVTSQTTPEICLDSEDGTIVVDITGGTAPYSTALNSNEDADFVLDRTEFSNLAAGNYLVFIRDANGCETNVVVDIERGVNLNAEITPVYECNSDLPSNFVNITLEDPSVLGEILYGLDVTDPLNPAANELQLNPDFRNSTPGIHYITIAHTNGCVQTFEFEIEAFEPLTLYAEQRNLNEITAIAEGGREEYIFYFDGRENGNDNTIFITRTDTYEIRVVDANGCEAITNIFMEFIDVEMPNFFTPDGDGQNDFWVPRNLEPYPEILIKIFDRYGRVVSELAHDSQGWDGLYNGKELPTGDYWYVIQLNGEEDEREFVGHFTLYR
ncbi:T9SS type B sorting domain-containing protein [Maribacter sp. 2210JD10-5]|uniref:T9SS type B sorting domain-containing protein n=1 Tax=Maribacter sp. 2210JD10-5 TaxID=3386272 RepID=UPI0039BD3954